MHETSMNFNDIRTCRRDPSGLKDVLRRLVAGMRECLGELHVGTYLQGSQATGDFDESSDVDFLVVVDAEVPRCTVDRLQEFHRSLYEHPSYWGQHLEGSYVPKDALKKLPPPRQQLLYLDHGHTTFQMSDHDHFLAVLWLLREKGVVLDGPKTKGLVSFIPADALRDETRQTMEWWANLVLSNPKEMTQRWYQAFTVLNYCRMAVTFCTGEVNSKRHGVQWAKDSMDTKWHGFIDRAVTQRTRSRTELMSSAEPQVLLETKEFIQYVLAEFIHTPL